MTVLPFPSRPLHVEQQDNAYGFAPVRGLPRARFHPADPGAVRLGVTRLCPEIVEELRELFQRVGAWELHDDLLSARDGIVEPPYGLSQGEPLDQRAAPSSGAVTNRNQPITGENA